MSAKKTISTEEWTYRKTLSRNSGFLVTKKKKSIDIFVQNEEINHTVIYIQGRVVHYLSHTSLALLAFLSTLGS